MLLATLYERDGDTARANERYRRTVALDPGHVVALNNLAYSLATSPQATPEAKTEAVALARRAAALAPRAPAVLDTLAWVLHLAGDNASARSPIALAIQLAPKQADLLLHGARDRCGGRRPGIGQGKTGPRAGASIRDCSRSPKSRQLQKSLPAGPGAGGRWAKSREPSSQQMKVCCDGDIRPLARVDRRAGLSRDFPQLHEKATT